MYYITTTPMIMFKNTVHPVMALAHWLSTACGDWGWPGRTAHALEDFVISLHFLKQVSSRSTVLVLRGTCSSKEQLLSNLRTILYSPREKSKQPQLYIVSAVFQVHTHCLTQDLFIVFWLPHATFSSSRAMESLRTSRLNAAIWRDRTTNLQHGLIL